METRDLATFVRVAEDGDFSSAARSLGLTPSAVSKAIARIEDHLGRQLLQRSSRTMHLTAEGESFLDAARRVLAAVEEAEAVGAVAVRGTLHIRCTPGFARYQLAVALPTFCARYPDLRIEIDVNTERSAHLDDGADVSITTGPIPTSNLIAKRFSSSRWVICAAPDYLARRGTPASPADLVHHEIVNFPVGSVWHASWSAHAAFRPVGRFTANQPEVLLALAVAGAGVARLPEFQIARDLKAGHLVRLFPEHQDSIDEPLYALHHARRNVSPRIKAFLAFLDESFGHHPWRSATGS